MGYINNRTGAVVTVTLEMHDLGDWDENCTVKQIYEQAEVAARQRLNKLVDSRGNRIVGEILVSTVTSKAKRV